MVWASRRELNLLELAQRELPLGVRGLELFANQVAQRSVEAEAHDVGERRPDQATGFETEDGHPHQQRHFGLGVRFRPLLTNV